MDPAPSFVANNEINGSGSVVLAVYKSMTEEHEDGAELSERFHLDSAIDKIDARCLPKIVRQRIDTSVVTQNMYFQ